MSTAEQIANTIATKATSDEPSNTAIARKDAEEPKPISEQPIKVLFLTPLTYLHLREPPASPMTEAYFEASHRAKSSSEGYIKSFAQKPSEHYRRTRLVKKGILSGTKTGHGGASL